MGEWYARDGVLASLLILLIVAGIAVVMFAAHVIAAGELEEALQLAGVTRDGASWNGVSGLANGRRVTVERFARNRNTHGHRVTVDAPMAATVHVSGERQPWYELSSDFFRPPRLDFGGDPALRYYGDDVELAKRLDHDADVRAGMLAVLLTRGRDELQLGPEGIIVVHRRPAKPPQLADSIRLALLVAERFSPRRAPTG